jgi:hypothetical protein
MKLLDYFNLLPKKDIRLYNKKLKLTFEERWSDGEKSETWRVSTFFRNHFGANKINMRCVLESDKRRDPQIYEPSNWGNYFVNERQGIALVFEYDWSNK